MDDGVGLGADVGGNLTVVGSKDGGVSGVATVAGEFRVSSDDCSMSTMVHRMVRRTQQAPWSAADSNAAARFYVPKSVPT